MTRDSGSSDSSDLGGSDRLQQMAILTTNLDSQLHKCIRIYIKIFKLSLTIAGASN